MISNIKAIFATSKIQIKQGLARPTFRFCILIQPVLYTFILYMIYSQSENINHVNQVVLGSGLCALWSAICFSSAGDVQREAYEGTLENISSVPVPFYLIILGKIFANTFLGLWGMFMSVVSIYIFTGQTMNLPDYKLFIIAFLGMMLAFFSTSLVIAPIFVLSRKTRILMNCIEYPIFIICGLVVEVNMLPERIRWLSYILPPTWGAEVLRDTANGVLTGQEFICKLIILIGISVIYIVISYLLFKIIDKKIRILATLGVN